MSQPLCRQTARILEKAASTGYRALIVYHTRRLEEGVRLFARLAHGNCLLVAPRDYRTGACTAEYSPMDIEDYLGMEFGSGVIASPGLLRPSVIASAAETIRGGGFLAIVVPPREEWDPGPVGSRGLYKRYLEEAIPGAGLHAWISSDCKVYSASMRVPDPGGEEARVEYKSRKGVPRRLLALARTPDQASGLDVFASFLRGRWRSLFVTGNRGRGKSYLVGLGLAYGAYRRLIGRVEVVAPSPSSVQSLMRGLLAGLGVLGVPHRRVESSGNIVRVSGPWYRVSYESPEAARGAPITVVDEAGAVGVARVRRLSWRSGKIIVSTTVHGYEGSGRVFLHMVESLLPRPIARIVLETPIRYRTGDPLEKWVYDTFILDPEPEGPSSVPADSTVYRQVDAEELVDNRRLLRLLYSVLVLAHYRNTPDDLLALLEGRERSIHALFYMDHPVAVAELVEESWEGDPRARLGLEKLALYSPTARKVSTIRVSRIAVLPWLQGRGLGSRLLTEVKERITGRDAVTVVFSRSDVVGFWAKNGFLYYYASPRYNKVTGEKNLAAALPLTERGEKAVREASSVFRVRLLVTLQSIYRDLPAERVPQLIEATSPSGIRLELTGNQVERLRACASGLIDPEQAWDALLLGTVKLLSASNSIWDNLGDKEKVFIAARLLQGKNSDEAAAIAGVQPGDSSKIIKDFCSLLVKRLAPYKSNP